MTGEDPREWTRRLLVLAAVSAIAVSVIYLPQSLLTAMGEDLGVAPATASAAATAVQVGYAAGILLLVPLADRLHPRRQVTVQSVLLAVALAASAVLPEVVSVAVGFLVVGLVANTAQIIIPTASRIAPPGRAGAATSTLLGALLIGIFGGRIVSSLLVDLIGWRTVCLLFAAVVLVAVPFVRQALAGAAPPEAVHPRYPRLLVETVTLLRRSPALLQSSIMQFFVFATFISLWTVMVLHLTEAPFSWTVPQAGLFGTIGLVAGVLTPLGGRLVDRFGALPVAGALLGVLLLCCVTMIADSDRIVAFAASVLVATWANQSIQTANQTRALRQNPGRGAQANTMFMFVMFLGGSLGAFLGPIAYTAGGMPAVAVQASVLVLLSCLTWTVTVIVERRRTGTAEAGGSVA